MPDTKYSIGDQVYISYVHGVRGPLEIVEIDQSGGETKYSMRGSLWTWVSSEKNIFRTRGEAEMETEVVNDE